MVPGREGGRAEKKHTGVAISESRVAISESSQPLEPGFLLLIIEREGGWGGGRVGRREGAE